MKIFKPKVNICDYGILLITFICVFQPPILPISLIYLVGIIALFMFFINYRRYMRLFICSEILTTYNFFLILFLYMMCISVFNILFVEQPDLLSNRIRCVNQLLILSLIQFVCIGGILNRARRKAYTIDNVIEILIYAGLLQGLLAVLAYLIPDVRSLFLKYADRNIWDNAWVIQRRGYGFSLTLLDTFGYGMGLLGGYTIFTRRKNTLLKCISIVFIAFSIFTNSRTGIVILAIAVIVELIFADKIKFQAIKLISGVCLICVLFFVVLPPILEWGMSSSNTTITWVVSGVNELYQSIISGNGLGFEDATYISDVNTLPNNILEFAFGSGHSVYGTRSILGIATDIGYINNIWIYGLVGTIAIELFFANLFFKTYKVANRTMKKIVILNAISYFIVQFKAILIGYNPGVFITYLSTFAILYYAKDISNIKVFESLQRGD